MPRIAVPVIGGMAISTLLTLFVIPAIYAPVKAPRVDAAARVLDAGAAAETP